MSGVVCDCGRPILSQKAYVCPRCASDLLKLFDGVTETLQELGRSLPMVRSGAGGKIRVAGGSEPPLPLNLAISDLIHDYRAFVGAIPASGALIDEPGAPEILRRFRIFARTAEDLLSPPAPARTLFLGPCGCGRYLYAAMPVLGPFFICAGCGRTHDVAERRARLFEAVRGWRGTAIVLARLLGPYFDRTPQAVAGRLYVLAHRHSERLPELAPIPPGNRSTYRLGDVLDVLTSDDRLRASGMSSHAVRD